MFNVDGLDGAVIVVAGTGGGPVDVVFGQHPLELGLHRSRHVVTVPEFKYRVIQFPSPSLPGRVVC